MSCVKRVKYPIPFKNVSAHFSWGYRHLSTHSIHLNEPNLKLSMAHKASLLHAKHISFAELERLFGATVKLENKISPLLPKRSTFALASHNSIVKLLQQVLHSLIDGLLVGSAHNFSSQYYDLVSYLASSLLRSLLVLNRMEEAISLLHLLSRTRLATGDSVQSILYYFALQANESQPQQSFSSSLNVPSFPLPNLDSKNNFGSLLAFNSNGVFTHSRKHVVCKNTSLKHIIQLLHWHCKSSHGLHLPINMATLAIRCLKNPSEMGVALLIYKNGIILHPAYKYDAERVSILLEHSIDTHFYALTSLLLEEIEQASSSCRILSADVLPPIPTRPSLYVHKELLHWMHIPSPQPTRDGILSSTWGDLPLGQIPIIFFRKLLQKLTSIGRVHRASKGIEERKFLSCLIIQILRRISAFSPSFIAFNDPKEMDNSQKFVLDALDASIMLRSPEMTACIIYRLNPKFLFQHDNQLLFDFWRRSALASQHFELALDVIPAPTTLGHILAANAALVGERTAEVMELLSKKKDTFGWFHLLLLLTSSQMTHQAADHVNYLHGNGLHDELKITTAPLPNASSLEMTLIEEAKQFGYVENAIHWQIRLASCSHAPGMVWELLDSQELRAALPPSIESIGVIIPSIFSTARSRPDLFLERTLQYVEDLLETSVESTPSLLFALVLKKTIIKELMALEESLMDRSSSSMEGGPSTITDLTRICVRISNARVKAETWAHIH